MSAEDIGLGAWFPAYRARARRLRTLRHVVLRRAPALPALENPKVETVSSHRTYSFLGPAGTFTEAALDQVPEARGQARKPVNNVTEGLLEVLDGRSHAAMIAIENSIEGGVSTTQDALATLPGLQIVGEYMVNVDFVLVTAPGNSLGDVPVIAAHPVAYAQCQIWLNAHLPQHTHVPAASNASAAIGILDGSLPAQAAITAPGVTKHHHLEVVAEHIGDTANALTRFVLVTRTTVPPPPTGADKTSLIVELPEERPGALQDLLEQFSSRGINLSLLESRPIGDRFGRYRFVIDADGHIHDERMADALLGIRRFSPRVVYLGSYPRADQHVVHYPERYADEVFVEARDWLRGRLTGKPDIA